MTLTRVIALSDDFAAFCWEIENVHPQAITRCVAEAKRLARLEANHEVMRITYFVIESGNVKYSSFDDRNINQLHRQVVDWRSGISRA